MALIRRFKNFKTPRQQQKVEVFGECAKHGCTDGVVHCGRCKRWWKLDSHEKNAAYEKEECPFCNHDVIIHDSFCKKHQNTCPDCEQDHPLPGCPFRDLRDGKPIRPEHVKWLRKKIGTVDLEHDDLFSNENPRSSDGLKGRDLLLFLFGDAKGRIRATPDKKAKKYSRFGTTGRVMKLLEVIHNREVQNYDGWERGMSPVRSKHSNPERTKAGMSKPGAGKPGRPRKNSK